MPYCMATPYIWKYRTPEISLSKPEITDVIDISDTSTVNKYVKEVICPSECYFTLKFKTKKLLDDISNLWLPMMSLQIGLTLLLWNLSYRLFPDSFISNIHNFGADIIICLLCFVLYFVITFIYAIIFPKDYFEYYDEDKLRKRFVYDQSNNYIHETKAFNNYVIYEHNKYLESIYSSVKSKRNIARAVAIAELVVFLLIIILF